MSSPILKIDNHYRHTVSFVLYGTNQNVYRIENVSIKISKCYYASVSATRSEALNIPNTYDIVLVPSFDTYPLIPLNKNNEAFWMIRGKNDLEYFNITFEWLKQMSIEIYLEVKLKNIKTSKYCIVKSVKYLLDRNGETTSNKEYLPSIGSIKDMFELNLYKLFISKDFTFATFLNQNEIKKAMHQINDFFDEDLKGNQSDNESIFKSKTHPIIASRLIALYSLLKYSLNDSEDVWIFHPNFYGVGINFNNLKKAWKNRKKNR